MRVISGIYKRRMFTIPKTFKARPTTDFAKENLFNVLVNNYIDFEGEKIMALDLFAGTGGISIELISRGCKQVVSVEKDKKHIDFIKKIMAEVKTDKSIPIKGDAFQFIKSSHQQFDFIFADPPYDLLHMEKVPERIFQHQLLKEGGILVFEHGKNHDYTTHPNFIDHRAYGSVNFSFFRQTQDAL